jgi:ABC-2 type transport system ATP-binding protein
LPEERGVYRKMKVGAFLTYMARLKGVNDPSSSRVSDWLARVGLPEVQDKRCEELSKGMLQKVQLVAAVLHEPDLLIFDEPFSGLDPVNMRLLRDLILAEHRRGATILFSTHVMVQAEEICDHIIMLNHGRKVLDESLASIRQRHDPRAIRFEPLDGDVDLLLLRAIGGVADVVREGTSYRIDLDEGADAVRTLRAIAASTRPARLELQRPTLEDIFITLAGTAATTAAVPA